MGLHLFIGTTNPKSTVNSAVHSSEFGNEVPRDHPEGISGDTA